MMELYLRWKFPLKKYGMLPKYNISKSLASCHIALLPEKFYEKVEEGSIIIKDSKSFKFCKDGIIINDESQPLKSDLVIFATGFKGDEKITIIFSSLVFRELIMATSPLLLYRFIPQFTSSLNGHFVALKNLLVSNLLVV